MHITASVARRPLSLAPDGVAGGLALWIVGFALSVVLMEARTGWSGQLDLGDLGAFLLNYLHWVNGDIYGLAADDYVRSFLFLSIGPFIHVFGDGHGMIVWAAALTAVSVNGIVYFARAYTASTPRLWLAGAVGLTVVGSIPVWGILGASTACASWLFGAESKGSRNAAANA